MRFLCIIFVASYISELNEEMPEIRQEFLSISHQESFPKTFLVQDICKNWQTRIRRDWRDFKDGKEKIAKKETDTALSQTLVNYGVVSEKLSKVNIEVANPSGAMYWLITLLPFILPFIFILIAMSMAFYVRAGPVNLNGLDSTVEANIYNNIKNIITYTRK